MKKLLILLFLLLLLSNICYAEGLNLGDFDGKSYVLLTDTVRFCSTPSCLYIEGKEQSFVGALINVASPKAGSSGDVLSYSKTSAYETKAVLFSRDGSKFVLVRTSSFDVNGNPIGSTDETVEIVEVETSLMVKDKQTGAESAARSKPDEHRRKIAWSMVMPGTAGEKITNAVLDFAESNYDYVLRNSKSTNFLTIK